MIQDTLHKLQELQEILAQKYQIENELKEIPKALSTKEELVSRLKQSYIDHNDRLTSGKKTLGELRIKMDDAEHEREELEEKMGSINTQREYETLVKDIQFASEREQDMRKEVQKEEKSLDELQQTIESEESLITEQTKELEAEQQKIYTETEKRQEQLDELDKLAADITPEMDKEIIFKFKRIIRSKGGQGIVPLRSSVCSGCNMILPTQFVNEVKAEIKIHFCPYCSMILYFQPDSGEVSINFDTSLFGDDIPDDNFDEIEDDIFADETEENDEDEEDELSSNDDAIAEDGINNNSDDDIDDDV